MKKSALPLLLLALPALAATPQQVLLKQVGDRWTPPVVLPEAAVGTRVVVPGPTRALLKSVTLESLSFVKTPLSAALESLAEQVRANDKFNMVLVGNADPEITLNVKGVTLEEALGLMLEGTGLVYEIKDGAVIVRPANLNAGLETAYIPVSGSLLTRLVGAEAAKTPGAAGTPALYGRSGAEAALKSFLERVGVVWSEGTGMALADGELILTHNAKTIELVRNLVGRLARNRQVEIEARFMEVEEGALDQVGLQWRVTNSAERSGGTLATSGSNANSLRSLSQTFSSGTTSGAPSLPGSVNLATAAMPTADITGLIDSTHIRGVLTALSQQQGTELLSAPRVTVLSGATATITVAQEMRYPQSYDRVNTDVGSGSSGGAVLTAPTPLDFTTRNVGVQMLATPYVEEDGSVTLVLQPEVTQFERFIDYGGQSVVVNGSVTQTLPSGFYQPVFSVRRLTTEVNLPSGATVLLGGLTREESVKVKDKVPLLGDIPLLGKAFRNEGTSTTKKNLVVFVTAHLVEAPEAPAAPMVMPTPRVIKMEVAPQEAAAATDSSAPQEAKPEMKTTEATPSAAKTQSGAAPVVAQPALAIKPASMGVQKATGVR